MTPRAEPHTADTRIAEFADEMRGLFNEAHSSSAPDKWQEQFVLLTTLAYRQGRLDKQDEMQGRKLRPLFRLFGGNRTQARQSHTQEDALPLALRDNYRQASRERDAQADGYAA